MLIESAALLPCLQGVRHVPLEYVCAIDTATPDQPDAAQPIWYTSCSIHSTPLPKETLEQNLMCSLPDMEYDEDDTYLFVCGYLDADLTYSNWTRDTDNIFPTTASFRIGRLTAEGEAADDVIHVFRFPKKTIVRNSLQGV